MFTLKLAITKPPLKYYYVLSNFEDDFQWIFKFIDYSIIRKNLLIGKAFCKYMIGADFEIFPTNSAFFFSINLYLLCKNISLNPYLIPTHKIKAREIKCAVPFFLAL